MTRPNSSDFDRLRKLIEHGWCKLNTDGSHTYVGESPYYDLYWAVRALDQQFPVQPNLDPIFLKLAHAIAELYPERVREPEISTSTRCGSRSIAASWSEKFDMVGNGERRSCYFVRKWTYGCQARRVSQN
jgi:hypothetical protein